MDYINETVDKLNKPFSRNEYLDFIVRNNHNNGYTIKELDDCIVAIKPVISKEDIDSIKREQIAMLNMTPLDFVKVLEELGLTWTNLKAIMTQYPDVEKELTMCQLVYRGNPLLNQMIPMVNKTFGLSITEQQLDLAFAKKNNREDLLEGGKE